MDGDEICALKKDLRAQGFNLYVYSHTAGSRVPEHRHNYHVLHVVLFGKLCLHIDGKDVVLGPGDRYNIPPASPHSADVVGDDTVICMDATKFEH
jgi:quercetin dioxygenase-like cupin family protein